MAISKRRGAAGRSSRRSRTTNRSRRTPGSKGRTLSPSSFRGEGAVPRTRRTIARGAESINPKLNREIA